MNVLVIGGTRFLGYLTTWRLLAAGHRVTHLNRGTHPDPFSDRIERLRGDRKTDLARLVKGRRFDAAVDFFAYDASDARGVIAHLDVGHYILISTGQVYLVREGCPRPAREEDFAGPLLPRPTDPEDLAEWEYGIGKRECENVLLEAHRDRNYPATIIRIPVVHGERDHTRRLESYLWRVLDGGPLLLPDGGTARVRHVYAGDVVRTLVEILGNRATFGRAFNLAQEETPTLVELVVRIATLLGAPPRIVPVPPEELSAAGLDPKRVSPLSTRWSSFVDPTRARRELGFRATPLDEYLARIVASFLAHPPEDRPEGYARRADELALARRLTPGSSSG